MSDTVTIRRNGLTLTGPAKPKRNAYIRVSVTIDTDQYDCGRHTPYAPGEARHEAWSEAVSLAYSVYGCTATEDNTVGQLAQVDGVRGEKRTLPCQGRTFTFGLNLWGKKVRDLHARIAAAAAAS